MMEESIGTGSDLGPERSEETLENYVPYENVDLQKYELLSASKAIKWLDCVDRTVYKAINRGDLLFTIENKRKKVLRPYDPIEAKKYADRIQTIPDRSERGDLNGSERYSEQWSDPVPNRSEPIPDHSEWVGFMRETMNRMDALYASKEELVEKNASFKLLTDNASSENTELREKNRLLDAENQTLTSNNAVLKARIEDLEKQLEEAKKKKFFPW